MELLQNFVSTQSATEGEVNDSITTLVDRLSHSTLISDRRSAILSLKSFSRQYREIVIAKGLKCLVSNLSRDSMDNDVVKATLETLLILFIRGEGDEDVSRNWISEQARQKNGKYPSPTFLKNKVKADQFSLWIADEFTQSIDNIELLLDFLEIDDMHIRIYTLQLLQALCTTRATRTKELIMKIPTAVSKLCSALDEAYEPIRNEAILLLMAIVKDNFNIQKLVVFENTFDKLYRIIEDEGGVMGNIIVQDCLTLINNLLSYNTVNQKYFLETNCIANLSRLISQPLSFGQTEKNVWNPQRLQNVLTALATCRLFVPEDTNNIEKAQTILDRSNLMLSALQLAFGLNMPTEIRVASLLVTADIIRGNNPIQAKFSMIDVPYLDPGLPNTAQKYEDPLPVLYALLNWCLYVNSVHFFDLRVASSTTLKAYFKNNDAAKITFLKEQIHIFAKINGYSRKKFKEVDGEVIRIEDTSSKMGDVPLAAETDNASSNSNSEPSSELSGSSTSLNVEHEREHDGSQSIQEKNTSDNLDSSDEDDEDYRTDGNIIQELVFVGKEAELNPYKIWFSADLLIYLLHEFEQGKKLMMAVTIGNDEADEDLVNILDAIGQALCLCLKFSDPRIPISYAMLLVCWIWEDYEAVDICLSDASILDQLLSFLIDNSQEDTLIMCTVSILLGVLYEYSRPDSPIPRSKLFTILNNRIGSNSFSLKIQQFMLLPQVKTFDALSYSKERDETGLPEVFFTPIFISLVKDNYYRIKGSFGRDPSIIPERRLNFEAYEKVQVKFNKTAQEFDDLKKLSADISRKQNEEKAKLEGQLQKVTLDYEHSLRDLDLVRKSREQLSEEFESTKNETSRLKALEGQLRTEIADISSRLDNASSELYNLKSENSKMTAKLKQVTEQKGKAEDGINKMNRALMDLTRQKSADLKKTKELEESLSNTRQQMESLKKNFQGSASEKDKEIALLKSKINALKSEQEASTTSYNSLSKSLHETSDRLKGSEEKVTNLLGKIHQAASLIESLKEENDSLKEKVKSQSALILRGEEEKNSLKNKSDELSKKVDSLQDELTSTFEEFSTLQESSTKEVDTLNSEITSFKAEISGLKEEKTALEKRVEVLSSKIDEREEAMQKTASDQEATIKEMENSHTSTISKLNSEIKEKDTEIQKLTEKLKNGEKKSLKTTDDLDNKSKENILLHQKQVELENKIKDYISAIEKEKGESENSINALQSKIGVLKKQVEENRQKSEEELEEKSALLLKKEGTLSDLKEKLKECTTKFESSKTEIDSLNRHIEDLKSGQKVQISKLLAQVEEGKKEFEKKQESVLNSQKEWKNRCDTKDSHIKEMEIEISGMQKIGKDQEGKIEALRKECEDALSEKTKSTKILLEQIVALKKSAEVDKIKIKNQEEKFNDLLVQKKEQAEKLTTDLFNLKQTIKDGDKGTSDLQKELEETRRKLQEDSKSFKKQLFDKDELLAKHKEELRIQSTKLETISKNEDEIVRLKENISSNTMALDKSKLLIEELKKENKSLKAIEIRGSELQKSLEMKEKAISQSDEKVKSLEKAKEELEQSSGKELAGLQNAISSLEENLKISKEENTALKNDVSERTKEFDELRQMLKEREESFNKVSKENSMFQERLKSETEKHRQENEKLAEELRAKEKVLTKVQSESDKLHSNLSDLKNSYSTEISKLKKEIRELETRTVARKNELKALKDENASVKEKLNTIKSQRKEEAAKMTDFSNKMEELKKDNLEATEKLKKDVSDGKALASHLETKLKDAEKSNDIAYEVRDKVKEELNSTTKMLSERKEAYNKLLKEKNKADLKLETQAEQLKTLKLKSKQSDATKATVDKTLKNAQSRLDKETEENRKIKEQIKQLQSDLEKEKKKNKGPSQDDFDDMLMLLDAMDKKNLKMKKRLRELGETVASDDDDDNEGEEDDGEEKNESDEVE